MSKNEEEISMNSIFLENSLVVKGSHELVKSNGELQTEGRYVCKICDIGFSAFQSLKDHLSALHTVKITKQSHFCQSCEKSFPSKKFQVHLHCDHTLEKIDACVKCNIQLPYQKVIPTRPSGDPYPEHYCLVCEIEIKTNKRKEKEVIKEQSCAKKKPPPVRDVSKRTVSRICGLKKTFTCEVCMVTYVTRLALDKHLVATHGVRKKLYHHHCGMCQKGFQHFGNLKAHQLREHVVEKNKPHACGKCGKKFASEDRLQKHSLQHNAPKQRCDVCLTYVTGSYMRVHMRTHSGILPYACVVCGKRFSTSARLKAHLVCHTGEKPYVCEMCGKAFGRREHLKTHLRVHTGERPYVCDVCQRGFTQKWVMYTHKRIHTGERPFECDVCQRGFIYKSQLKTHRLTRVKDSTGD